VPIDSTLLEILRCPLTKQSLSALTSAQIDRINQRILAGELNYADGTTVDKAIDEGLITENGLRAYRIDDGIPVMLHHQSITLSESDLAGIESSNSN